MTKINVFKIIRDHWRTLVNANTNKTEFGDWFTFLIFPLMMAMLIEYIFPEAAKVMSNSIITVLAIFIGLLINVIVLLFDLLSKEPSNKKKKELLSETLTNIAYTILVSIFAIVTNLLTFVEMGYFKCIFSFITYFLVGNIMLTLLMVIKRMYAMFKYEMDNTQ